MADKPKNKSKEVFEPKGTMVVLIIFFITLIVLWGTVYFILLQRGTTV